MHSAPLFTDWKALRLAAIALIASGVTGNAKAFLKAVREAKAAAIVLLFALARSLWTEDVPAPRAGREGRGSVRSCGFRLGDGDDDAWRNPPVTACRLESQARAEAPGRPGASADPKRLDGKVTAAFLALRRILSLCDDPETYASRLHRRLERSDLMVAAAEARAFGVHARAQARRNREARRALDRGPRGRRRARRETG